MERLSRKGIRPRRKCTGERFSWWWFRCFLHLHTKTIFTTWNLMEHGAVDMLVFCVVAFILVTCSLSPGSHSSSLWILQTALPTRYEVIRSWSINPTLWRWIISICSSWYMVLSQLSHVMDVCQIRWKTDKTVIKPMMCTHIHVYTYQMYVIRLWYDWYACDAGLWQTRWYVLWGCWILLSPSTSVLSDRISPIFSANLSCVCCLPPLIPRACKVSVRNFLFHVCITVQSVKSYVNTVTGLSLFLERVEMRE